MDYLKLLEHSYKVEKKYCERQQKTRYEFLSEYIFDFTTYDAQKSELFAKKAVEVCEAINNRKTFEYIKDDNNYNWYLMLCNTTFFHDKIEWGTSIRGAFWSAPTGTQITLLSCGLWFEVEEWKCFIAAIIEFVSNENKF